MSEHRPGWGERRKGSSVSLVEESAAGGGHPRGYKKHVRGVVWEGLECWGKAEQGRNARRAEGISEAE